MGLFSFLKKAGKKLTGKSEPKVEEAVKSAEVSKLDAMKSEITRLGIPVNGLNLEMAEQIVISGETATNADREKIILALGNCEGVGCVEDRITVTNPEPEAKFYTVQSGDTLSKISKAQYGDPMKYNSIFEANKPMLDHPDKIYPGQVLRIPQQ
ncbi:peptidoglycan-binding protein LysM [Portibacter lacus]|uniref:Potassium binding protein Kbp n=1 Tax=Portibacter lacus TaxID=1099794 RepID=A0AA37SQL5_9BACT|nr:peptidoglycan-binding protein LysM [Portibacter lacus]GLR17649.1 peptidoglycan-binding protein LysM [Portibacter lacus]